jgi:ABC-type Zn uptake system ZnuABC Zn-binding protein ZnuA
VLDQDHTKDQDHDDHTEDQDHDDHTSSLDLTAIAPIAEGERLNVVATTNIVGDVVGTIGGDAINLTVLIPLGADPHTFEPTPQDIAAIADADMVFANGVGLEAFLDTVLVSAGADERKVIFVSHGIALIAFAGKPKPSDNNGESDHQHTADEGEAADDHDHSGQDPHVWFSPMSVDVWITNIEQTLVHADPANADTYTANAATYREDVHELDKWIQEQVAQVPEANRQLVTDHMAFGYFAHRYGFEQIGAVIPGYSSMAEPSAQELAALEDAIREYEVPALFVGTTANPVVSERLAEDTGIQMVSLYTGSLSEAGGPADTYLKLMRYDTQAIVEALTTP